MNGWKTLDDAAKHLESLTGLSVFIEEDAPSLTDGAYYASIATLHARHKNHCNVLLARLSLPVGENQLWQLENISSSGYLLDAMRG